MKSGFQGSGKDSCLALLVPLADLQVKVSMSCYGNGNGGEERTHSSVKEPLVSEFNKKV